MGKRIRKLKKQRLHSEGNDTLTLGLILIVAVAALLWHCFTSPIPFWIFIILFGSVYGVVVNFYRCPIRYLDVDDTSKIVAPSFTNCGGACRWQSRGHRRSRGE